MAHLDRPRNVHVHVALFASVIFTAAACGSSNEEARAPDDGGISLGDGGFVDAPAVDAAKTRVDGGFEGPDGAVLRADRFITTVVSFTPGPCAGFGAGDMPGIIEGPPVGAGEMSGSLDVLSLGYHGELVVAFEPNAIVDGPGPDFIVFENPFYIGGDANRPYAEPGEISVSEDGATWKTFACTPTESPPFGACAGWHPVYSAPGNGISPVDPATAGGEAYDLATVGLTKARFVRVRDMATKTCVGEPKPNNFGFDLDAMSIVNAAIP